MIDEEKHSVCFYVYYHLNQRYKDKESVCDFVWTWQGKYVKGGSATPVPNTACVLIRLFFSMWESNSQSASGQPVHLQQEDREGR